MFKITLKVLTALFFILITLYFTGLGKVIVNGLTGLDQSITEAHQEGKLEEEIYLESLHEYDNKLKSLLEQSQNKLNCNQIKAALPIESQQKQYKINYSLFINENSGNKYQDLAIKKEKKKQLDKQICEIYNFSNLKDIYLEIPYKYSSSQFSKEARIFINKYSTKGYNIHAIYFMEDIKNLTTHRSLVKFGNQLSFKSIILKYRVKPDESISEIYNKLKGLKNFYLLNYKNLLKGTEILISLDFKTKVTNDYWGLQLESIKEFYQLEGNKAKKEREFDYDVSLTHKQITKNIIIPINDDLLKGFISTKSKTDSLLTYLNKQRELFNQYRDTGKLVFDIKLSKENFKKIDWLIVESLTNYNYINFIFDQVQSIDFKIVDTNKEFDKIKDDFKDEIKEKDLLFLYYKYKSTYLEKKD